VGACLTLEGITKHRSGRDRSFALTIDRLELRPGDRLLLAGPNGCGKSTLMELIGLALRPDGAARFELAADGRQAVDLQALWQQGRHDELARLRARHMGYLPQTGALLPFLTVRQNILLVQELSGRRDPELVREISRRLDLDPLAAEWPAQLSVGQRQRAAIARAIVHRPSFVLADEPTAALDPANAQAVVQLLVDLVRELDCGLLLVSHEPALAARCGLEPLELDWAVEAAAWRTWVTRAPVAAPAAEATC
jgi:putative ABC transport system ATP-binding protein